MFRKGIQSNYCDAVLLVHFQMLHILNSSIVLLMKEENKIELDEEKQLVFH